MTSNEFDNHLVAYNEGGNDYRYIFTREEAAEIKAALNHKSLVEEIRELIQEENEKR